jgi:hypothetical protein
VAAADAFLRSSFLSMRAAHEASTGPDQAPADWAARFWHTNWLYSTCLLEEPVFPSDSSDEDANSMDDSAAQLVRQCDARYESFVGWAMSAESVDLREPERHEVVCGLATRAYRAIRALATAPHMWTGEHSAWAIRLLFETEIYLRWLDAAGPDGFVQFKSYGLGKRKLLRIATADFRDRLADEAPEILERLVDQLTEDTGGEWGEAFQEVNLDANFAGTNLRAMSEELGEIESYRVVYQPASGVAHGEWWAISDYAMQRCMNPLHRFHEVPSASQPSVMDGFVGMLLGRLDRLMAVAEEILSEDTKSAESASD